MQAHMSVPFSCDVGEIFPERLVGREQAMAELPAALARLAASLDRLRADHAAAAMPHWALPSRRDDLAALEPLAARLRTQFADVVVLATGGSSLGGRALLALTEGRMPGARVTFCDNLDPAEMDELLRGRDLARTAFLVISKSGGTGETLTQALVCLDAIRAAAPARAPRDHFFAVVEPGDSPLRRLAEAHGIETVAHDPDLGGRYSVLSVVGMLPAMIAGLDTAAVRNGALAVLDQALAADAPGDVPAAAGAALAVTLARTCGAASNVLMPYSSRLEPFALWYRQLWAESLGKDGKGLTPVSALGPVDQHSQLQLYLDGPADKQFTLLCLDQAGLGPRVPKADADAIGAEYLAGVTVGDLVSAQQDATAAALAARGRSTRVLRIAGGLDERTMGALFLHFMLETVFAAYLLGVDPFDQPAVEEGKVLTRRILGERAGKRGA